MCGWYKMQSIKENLECSDFDIDGLCGQCDYLNQDSELLDSLRSVADRDLAMEEIKLEFEHRMRDIATKVRGFVSSVASEWDDMTSAKSNRTHGVSLAMDTFAALINHVQGNMWQDVALDLALLYHHRERDFDYWDWQRTMLLRVMEGHS